MEEDGLDAFRKHEIINSMGRYNKRVDSIAAICLLSKYEIDVFAVYYADTTLKVYFLF